MGSCQNYGPVLGTLNNRCRIILGTPKRDINIDNHPYSKGGPLKKGGGSEIPGAVDTI